MLMVQNDRVLIFSLYTLLFSFFNLASDTLWQPVKILTKADRKSLNMENFKK